jgi:hypothetical protein
MDNLEKSLNKIAESILHFDEASLTALWEKYKNKIEQFSTSPDWEKAVIIFSIINAVRAKNAIFNEMVMNNKATGKNEQNDNPQVKPHLKLVK